MIGIVVVSHSHPLAAAAVGLAFEMVEAERLPRIEVAAGLNESTFGTDATAVAEAINAADSPDGVLVLLDLGSAILSAEMALEFLDPEVAEHVRLSSAPLVEGLVAAVVTASTGADIGQVNLEAERGLLAKSSHLGAQEPQGDQENVAGAPADQRPDAVTRELLVDIPHGLHARPAARFVHCVNRFPDARVQVRKVDGALQTVDAGSLSSVATLSVGQGDRIAVSAAGSDAEEVLAALAALAASGFGDQHDERSGSQSQPSDGLSASSMGSGLDAAIGVLVRAQGTPAVNDYESSGDPEVEGERLVDAVESAASELQDLIETTRATIGAREANIFEAHLAMVRDTALLDPTRRDIAAGLPAALAWARAGESVQGRFAELDDVYQRERAHDVRSVTGRVLRHLVGPDEVQPSAVRDGQQGQAKILLVEELDPGAAADVDIEAVAGILTTRGGSTGHGVLIAAARGVPILTGVVEIGDVAAGTLVAFDARARQVLIDPSPEQCGEFESMLAQRVKQQDGERAAAAEPGRTRDGLKVSVKANVTSATEAAQAVERGAEGSGLVRTEVMFGQCSVAPSVEEQVVEFTAIAEALNGGSMTIRTWDIGADKALGFWAQEAEQNPFLGVRGVRSFRDHPRLLQDQLQAVCQVARNFPVRVMFPMVATVAEVNWALEQLERAGERVAGGRPDGLEVGVMIEVPAAALRAQAMSVSLDFVSIGTNDLTQYTMAAERGNAGVDYLFDAMDPAVLRLVAQVCREVTEGVSVGVCGGAASDPVAAAVLVGLGVEDLSATAVAVPRVKAVLRRHTAQELRDLAERALRCHSAHEVRALLSALEDR